MNEYGRPASKELALALHVPVDLHPHPHYVQQSIQLEQQCVLRVQDAESHQPHHEGAPEIMRENRVEGRKSGWGSN